MFWEVRISGKEHDMMELCHALSDFFHYAAGQSGQTLNETAFRRDCPQIADWLLKQFNGREKNKQKLQQAVKGLFQLSKIRRRGIASAVAHDMKFYQAGSSPSFSFQTAALPQQEWDIVDNFFSYFYNVAFDRAVGPHLNGHICHTTRGELSKDYYQTNPVLNHVCPVCLSHSSNAKKEMQLDHYFPKSRYPVLMVHPWNLMYICTNCNKVYKGQKDPLPQMPKTLDKVFLPYCDTVREHTALDFQWEPNVEEDRVKLRPALGCTGEKDKVDAFNALFQLEERWSSDLAGVFEQLRYHYARKGLDKVELHQALKAQYQALRQIADAGFPDKFLEAEYTAWLCEEQLSAFFENLSDPT